jgi:ABC-type multidrug transport system fused ATPase/permease subunit
LKAPESLTALAGLGRDGLMGTVAFRDLPKVMVARFVAATLARSMLSMATLVLIEQFLSRVLGNKGGRADFLFSRFDTSTSLYVVAGLLIATHLAVSLATYESQMTRQRIVRSLELGLMERILRKLLSLPAGYFERNTQGDLIQTVREDVAHLRSVLTALGMLILELVLALGLMMTAAWISLKLTVMVMLILPLLVVPFAVVSRKTLKKSYAIRKRGFRLFDLIIQIVRGIRVIRVYQGEEREAERSVALARSYFESIIDMTRLQSREQVLMESVGGMTIVTVVIAGGFQVLEGALAWPSLLAFLLTVRSMHGPLNNSNTYLLEIQRHGASIGKIKELLEEAPAVAEDRETVEWHGPPKVIRLENLSFSREGRTILDGIELEVGLGQTIGIVGPSGAGKSTLLSLLARFHEPGKGRITFNGVDTRSIDLGAFYREIAYVPQEPFLFAGTARDNIACGRPEATMEEVEAAARAAEIHDEINALAEGYDTVLGVGGRMLSQGQAQRLNIARALLKDAPILLLDEATSSLDSISEIKVQRAIDSLVHGRTTFVIAHRLSTLRNADVIVVLSRGRAVGIGPHERLIVDCPLYQRLYEAQIVGGTRKHDLRIG